VFWRFEQLSQFAHAENVPRVARVRELLNALHEIGLQTTKQSEPHREGDQ
jgi:hypothetical protein